jgi:hypothetical protein
MSDFDEVLERLLGDPVFQAALQADPEAALAGYQLDPEERGLLGAQFDIGAGEERTVEMRVTKSGVMGLVGPVVSALGLVGGQPTAQGTGSFGSVPQDEGTFDPGTAKQSFGEIPPAKESFGYTESPGQAPPHQVAAGYQTYVDADGDGRWDASTAYARADGGVDIHVDADGDGAVDFIGRDYDRDGLVDDADFDTNGDGVMDTRMHDHDGDGWMDRSAPIPARSEDVQTFGQTPPNS